MHKKIKEMAGSNRVKAASHMIKYEDKLICMKKSIPVGIVGGWETSRVPKQCALKNDTTKNGIRLKNYEIR